MDDLFEDDKKDEKTDEEKITVGATKNSNKGNSNKEMDADELKDAPVLPFNSEPEDEYDLQKELEAKFDELFGSVDEDDDE